MFVRIGEALRSRVRVRVENKKKGLGLWLKEKTISGTLPRRADEKFSKVPSASYYITLENASSSPLTGVSFSLKFS